MCTRREWYVQCVYRHFDDARTFVRMHARMCIHSHTYTCSHTHVHTNSQRVSKALQFCVALPYIALLASYNEAKAAACLGNLVLRGVTVEDALCASEAVAEGVMVWCVVVCCSVLRCGAVCRDVLWCCVVWCSELQCGTVRCSVLQCVAVCCSVLQCVAVCCSV